VKWNETLKLITLTTDFGLQDGFVGVMKGIIYSICPDARLVDITHAVQPQDILAGALVLERSLPYFPSGSVHLAVVDPGVGTDRRPMAAQIGDQYVVGPDNGLFTLFYRRAEDLGLAIRAVVLDQPRFWRDQVSYVFHGRDIFAPVAAHLANGVSLDALGSPLPAPLRLAIPQPQRLKDGWLCQVMAVDYFGTLQLNLTRSDLAETRVKMVEISGEMIEGMCNAFGDRPPGSLMALMDSSDHLSIAVVNGSAAARLKAAPGMQVWVRLES
jgi:S-adenosyl-L-methionine hydrolase (adenosine-forming)